MTHPDTVKLLADEYLRRIHNIGKANRERREYLEYAAKYGKAAEADAAAATEIAELLRTLDPDGSYPLPETLSATRDEPELATGLRQLADLMAKHPQLAPRVYKSVQHSAAGTTAEERIDYVEELADLIGAEPRWEGQHYAARLKLTGALEFLIVTTDSYSAADTARVLPRELTKPAYDHAVVPAGWCCAESYAKGAPCDECRADKTQVERERADASEVQA